MAVHHFNVPVAPDVSDRFMVLHYTDWESLNGRNINNWVRAEATPCSLRYDWVGSEWMGGCCITSDGWNTDDWMETLDKYNSNTHFPLH